MCAQQPDRISWKIENNNNVSDRKKPGQRNETNSKQLIICVSFSGAVMNLSRHHWNHRPPPHLLGWRTVYFLFQFFGYHFQDRSHHRHRYHYHHRHYHHCHLHPRLLRLRPYRSPRDRDKMQISVKTHVR